MCKEWSQDWSTYLEDYQVQAQDDPSRKISFSWRLQRIREDKAKQGSSIMVYGRVFGEVFIKHVLASTIKKGVSTWVSQDRHHIAQVECARQRYDLYRFSILPLSYWLGDRVIGSVAVLSRGALEVSILAVSFKESSNLCILGISSFFVVI